MHRRKFLKTLAPAIIPASALGLNGAVSPGNRISLAMIGTGNQGFNDLKAYLRDERVQVTAVCDVNRESPGYWDGGIAGREPARNWVEWHYAREQRSGIYKGVTAYDDLRQVLARKDIDAVHIALPDHWHGIAVVEAARAGKDIYGQKPLALTIGERGQEI